jgi:hypothetical protein
MFKYSNIQLPLVYKWMICHMSCYTLGYGLEEIDCVT